MLLMIMQFLFVVHHVIYLRNLFPNLQFQEVEFLCSVNIVDNRAFGFAGIKLIYSFLATVLVATMFYFQIWTSSN